MTQDIYREKMSHNPLSKFYRQPALYLRLPSNGKYWPQGSLDLPPNGEIPVLPMSGKDDLALRNADGLMNGATTVTVIQSCCPNIHDAWQVPSVDIDAIMIAIRMASYGSKMDFDTKCMKCNEDMSYTADLSDVLNRIVLPNFDNPFETDRLMFWFRPHAYKVFNEMNQQKYVQQRTIKSIQESNLSEDEKIEKFKEAVKTFTNQTVESIASFIDHVVTPDNQKVSDQDFIKEFISNADQKTYNALKDAITLTNQQYKVLPIQVTCPACGNQDERVFQFDPANFFG